jgi:excisionase family DNA binding protein
MDESQHNTLQYFEPLRSAEEIAPLVHLHPKTIVRFAREGSIPGKKIGKQWRFRLSQIDRWIESTDNQSRQPA